MNIPLLKRFIPNNVNNIFFIQYHIAGIIKIIITGKRIKYIS